MQDSLGGNCNTTIIATVSPASLAFEETCATLKFADRARNIVNRASVNLHTDFKLELELKTAEVKRLTALLAKFANMVDSSGKINATGANTARQSSTAAYAADSDPAAVATADISNSRDGSLEVQTSVNTAQTNSRGRAVSSSPSPYALTRSASEKGLRRLQTPQGSKGSPVNQWQQLSNSPDSLTSRVHTVCHATSMIA